MNSIDNDNKKSQFLYWSVVNCAFGLWCILMASIYGDNNGHIQFSIIQTPEIFIYVIFGFLHALFVSVYTISMNDSSSDVSLKVIEDILYFVSQWLLYSGLYSVILLPSCGLGFFEWLIVLIILFNSVLVVFGFHSDLQEDKKIMLTPLSLLLIDITLLFTKLAVSYFFPINLYDDLSGNDTAMDIIVFFCALLFIYLCKVVINSLIARCKQSGCLRMIQNGFLLFIQILSSFVFPFLIICLLVAGVVCYFKVQKIREDIIKLVGTILSRALSTDNTKYKESVARTFGEIIALIIFLFNFVRESIKIKQIHNSCHLSK